MPDSRPTFPAMNDSSIDNSILPMIFQEISINKPESLRLLTLSKNQVICEAGRKIEYFLFPISGLTSISIALEKEKAIDVLMLGRDGVIGAEAIVGQNFYMYTATQRVTGEAIKVKISDLQPYLDDRGLLRRELLRFVERCYWEASQIAVCNARHPVSERLARVLLHASDILGEPIISITHETLSAMLCIGRVGVTRAISHLEEVGAVRQRWGQIHILNRALLERSACNCVHFRAI